MNQVAGKLWQIFQQYSLKQKMVISTVLLSFISALIVLILWANRTEYDLLFANLSSEAASSIVSDLRESQIPYRIEDGGKSIYVPKESVAELRLKYAQAGYLKDSITGYELFENNKMGMTTFMQRLNMKRALEGELMRTINQFDEVQSSRVHLVIPEDRLFEENKKGSASVVLNLKPGASLNNMQLRGIASLVANSVEGIEPENVVVMDSRGDVLLEGKKEDNLLTNVSGQYQMQQALEKALQEKVKSIVAGVVGPENAVVKVTAELDFDQIERTREEYDPESKVLLSQEEYIESSNDQVDSLNNYTVRKVTSNYELSKTIERYVSNSGNIKRLAVAVLVNGKYEKQTDENGNVQMVYQPRSEEELNQIAALVKSAVGFNEDRGDVVEVQKMQLVNHQPEVEEPKLIDQIGFDFWQQLITYALIALGLLLAFVLLRNLLKTSINNLIIPGPEGTPALTNGQNDEKQQLSAPENAQKESLAVTGQVAGEEPLALPEDMFMKKLSPEARAKLMANDKMTSEVYKFVSEKPEDAAKLVRTWLLEENKR
ncbi:MAG TPA: flagellar M-ring protein FliF [Caldithrix abyssi]|uniref:Flagellar M-ring protein n=1 Tax=Caldithrix abyssi TaxID=187145 RepID=A0A7V5H373_CALAY|nr:flagellar M-ring protein FliF [Caldithrix abyssi]